MDFVRNLTSRDFFKALTATELIGSNALAPEKRFDQARWARRCRNFFFTASVPVPEVVPDDFYPGFLIAGTPRFSEPIVLTDMLSMVDRGNTAEGVAGTIRSAMLQVFDIGGDRGAYGDDFFGLSGPVPQEYILKHERNVTTNVHLLGDDQDRPGKWLGFVPRLLKPYQTLQLRYSFVPQQYPQLQTGFRALRVLQKDNPYQYMTTESERRTRNYVETMKPETFFMEVTATVAQVAAATARPLQLRTPQQDRPLMIIGAISNCEGVQGALYDESSQYRFDFPDVPLSPTPTVRQGYQAVPLNLWAPNSDFHNVEMANLFPVPHFLAPGAILRVELINGLAPNRVGAMTQTVRTNGEQDVRVTFICRSV